MSWPEAFTYVGITVAGAVTWCFSMWRITLAQPTYEPDEPDEDIETEPDKETAP